MSARSSEQVVTFQGHHSYIVSIARLCKENGLFTDVTLQCDDGKLLAHRIVLAAVSPFLRGVLDELPGGTQDFTIIVPHIRKTIVQQLLDFLYTGSMRLEQGAMWELQELVLLLKIDPENVGVEVQDRDKAERLASSSVCQTLGVRIASKAELPPQPRLSPLLQSSSSSPHSSPLSRLTLKTDSPLSNGVHQTAPSRPATRPKPLSSRPLYAESPPHSPSSYTATQHSKKLTSPGRGGSRGGVGVGTGSSRAGHNSTNGGPGARSSSGGRGHSHSHSSVPPLKLVTGSNKSKSVKRDTEPQQGDTMVVMGSSDNSNVINSQESLKIKIITNRKRRLSSDMSPPRPAHSHSFGRGSSEGGRRGRGVRTRGRARRMERGHGRGEGGRGRGTRGLHDWENSRTWVCAICGQYDPVQAQGATTEWIGCDCNRWFHKLCTKLKSVGEDFSCRQVNKVCLSS